MSNKNVGNLELQKVRLKWQNKLKIYLKN